MKTGTRNTLIFALWLICIGTVLVVIALFAGADMGNALDGMERILDGEKTEDFTEEVNMNTKGWDLVPVGSSFGATQVAKLDLELAAAQTVIVSGNDFSVKASGDGCSVKQDGDTLKISSRSKGLGFFKTIGRAKKIEITVPQEINLDLLDITVGAGSLRSDARLVCKKGKAEIGMGECKLLNFHSSEGFDVECGMGSVQITGRMEGELKIECGMGEVQMNLEGNPADYAYAAEVGMGSVKINDTEISGVGGNSSSPYSARNNLKVECGLGAVNIKIGR